jgi:hypothetical protein
MKFVEPRPFADPEAAARKLLELANAFERPHLYREDQLAISVRAQGHAGGVQSWDRLCDRAGLVGSARERRIREADRGWRGAVPVSILPRPKSASESQAQIF